VIFASDNGAAWLDKVFHHSGPLRGYKRDMYEGGIRTPAIARWPGHIKPGTVSDQVWAFFDFLPTMAELTGQSPPSGIDGVSILPALVSGKAIAHRPLYFEFHERGFDQAARIGDWKGVRNGANGPLELYDLKTDPGEKHDVASQNPAVVEQMNAFLKSARAPDPNWPIKKTPPAKKAQRKKEAAQ